MASAYPTHAWQQGQHRNQQQQYMQPQASQQLPPGWEAKYDQNYRRYYFVNHQTQETTWHDPRASASPRMQQHQAAQPQSAAQVQQAHSSRPAASPNARQTAARAAPKPQESIALQNMGSHSRQPTQRTETTQFSEERHIGISEREKSKVKNKIIADYDLPGSILEAALEAGDYSEDRIRQLLKSMGYRSKKEPAEAGPSEARSSRDEDTTRSQSQAQKIEDVKLPDFSAMYKTEPVKPEEEESEASVTVDSDRVDVTTPAAVSRADIHVSVSSSLSGLLQGGRDSESPMKSPDGTNLKNLIEEAAPRKRQYSKPSSAGVILSRGKGASAGGVSGLAKGPDFFLYKGPNTDLLQKEMLSLRGSDSSLCHGPRKEYLSKNRIKVAKRCSLAAGANKGLRRGPDRSLLLGNREATFV